MALAIDKHSAGTLDFRKLIGETKDEDWKFVKRKLRTFAPARSLSNAVELRGSEGNVSGAQP